MHEKKYRTSSCNCDLTCHVTQAQNETLMNLRERQNGERRGNATADFDDVVWQAYIPQVYPFRMA